MGRVSDARVKLMDAVLELIWTGSYGSTTIDHICEKAGVKKGSFYHFFDSKSVLAVEALDTSWQVTRAELDTIFSATVPPLERLQKYCDFGFRMQTEMREKYGHVLGCPLFSVGCEICTQEDALQKKIKSILDYKHRYIETAIRDAVAAGEVKVADPAAAARMVMAFNEGLMTQARIQNDLNVLREMAPGIFGLLGVTRSEAALA
jgi:TetR/AcrR family transcriptional regulator, transcriptional repressor for nem operon